ncbi:hypothetical protein [Bradyrhizobium sp. AUGA SZCCT0283]|uniref:hypothetical protein n=1 Tax=Bradyrhizobium sp. AUGA SZCCT0283 TaxID=2807671 RepID=UPI001BA71143|nr:hypothetical protein [Bradyrhizobium sp. AUGA SZCCT0283]MBR1274133.1 hypothetical protein [Bradyrhizobium sp. AUGA SZCCT0283]
MDIERRLHGYRIAAIGLALRLPSPALRGVPLFPVSNKSEGARKLPQSCVGCRQPEQPFICLTHNQLKGVVLRPLLEHRRSLILRGEIERYAAGADGGSLIN